ncbi:MAG: transposase family protein [Moorea sp. SIO3E2]|nr:transposase family protein [Moorena sp. SIO3E2]
MATMSDCYGYRALEDFARRHHQALLENLDRLPGIGRTQFQPGLRHGYQGTRSRFPRI